MASTAADQPEWMQYIRTEDLLDVVAVSSADAGKLLGVDGDTIGKLMQRGELRWVLVGSRRRIRLCEIRRYLDRQATPLPIDRLAAAPARLAPQSERASGRGRPRRS